MISVSVFWYLDINDRRSTRCSSSVNVRSVSFHRFVPGSDVSTICVPPLAVGRDVHLKNDTVRRSKWCTVVRRTRLYRETIQIEGSHQNVYVGWSVRKQVLTMWRILFRSIRAFHSLDCREWLGERRFEFQRQSEREVSSATSQLLPIRTRPQQHLRTHHV